MTEEPDDFDRLLGSLAKEGRLQPDPDPEEHPDSGTLYAYHEGKLSPEQRSRVEEHLSLCGRCRDLLVEYKEFAEDPVEEGGPEGRGRVADFGAAADWHRLRERTLAPAAVVAHEPGTPRGFFGSLRTAYSIAAVLALAVVGLSIYAVKQRQARIEPKLNSGWYVLSAADSSRTVDESEFLEVPFVEGKNFTFEIPAPHLDSSHSYQLDVYREGKRIYDMPGLVVQDDGSPVLRFDLDTDGWEPGKYEIRILSLREGSREEVGRYPFRFVTQ